MTTYSYETFPGQTMIRDRNGTGFTQLQLMNELGRNGDGVIVLHEEADHDNQFLLGLEGKDCADIRQMLNAPDRYDITK